MNNEVTALDLDNLRIAANALVDMANVYSEQAAELGHLPDPDESNYGRTHTWWAYVTGELEAALRYTHDRLGDGAGGLRRAIGAFTLVDAENSWEINQLGKEYAELVNDPDVVGDEPYHYIDPEHTKNPAPNLDDKPEGWVEHSD